MGYYACSDIHGQYDLYKKMLSEINFSEDDTLFILGDYIDRGDKSIDVMLDVMQRDNVIPIIGNHELMMWSNLWGNRERGDFWCLGNNCGEKTKAQYFDLDIDKRQDIKSFIRNLYLQYEIDICGTKYLLSHSSFMPRDGTIRWKEIGEWFTWNVTWDSPWRAYEYISIDNYTSDNRMHVIGHVPVPLIGGSVKKDEAYINREYNLVNIDLGCALMSWDEYDDVASLCCMDLEKFATGDDDSFIYIKEKK